MNIDPQKGKLKRWNDDKGFGFIGTDGGRRDIFVHISAFKRNSLRPVVGDVIIYRVHTDDGKNRAIDARIEGAAEIRPKAIYRNRHQQTRSNWIAKGILLAFVILLSSIAYTEFMEKIEFRDKTPAPTPSYVAKNMKSNFSCAGKVYCSEMTSCDEAKYYLRNCPGTKMDGDHDGIPCESQWCGW